MPVQISIVKRLREDIAPPRGYGGRGGGGGYDRYDRGGGYGRWDSMKSQCLQNHLLSKRDVCVPYPAPGFSICTCGVLLVTMCLRSGQAVWELLTDLGFHAYRDRYDDYRTSARYGDRGDRYDRYDDRDRYDRDRYDDRYDRYDDYRRRY